MSKSILITIKGRVQGVGFRPFVFQLAQTYEIKGTVQNNMDGVRIIAEGLEDRLNQFVQKLKSSPPRLSRIDNVLIEDHQWGGFKHFSIIPSNRAGTSSLVIPVDSAVCDDCLAEMNDPSNFRYHYPFINCTQCGPRYTIIEALPYDRPYTVMNDFHMCKTCAEEYENPANRRHHAQPIACDDCGPEIILINMKGKEIAKKETAISLTKRLLKLGKIIAIKGLGGYHLACDAHNDQSISKLRSRKNRPYRPLAVMAKSLDVVGKICYVSINEKKILKSPEAPIVVLEQREATQFSRLLAPGLNTLGVMLPYTPLHHLLFDDQYLDLLVMTSANPSGMPIVYQDDGAINYLDGIADYILTSNRDILHPLDDSVVQIENNKMTFFRRSRGFVPDPMVTQQDVHGIVALGSQQKNVFAIGRYQQIFLGPHIGDMDNVEVMDFFKREFNHLMKWMGVKPKLIAVDKHPLYSTASLAKEMDGEILEVQHHHAHMVACMEENGISEPAIGIILDGTGYGDDNNIWGFEILYGNARSYKRLAHLKYTPLPSGDKAVKEPWRNAVGMLIGYLGDEGKRLSKKLFSERTEEIEIINKMIENKINTPLAGTCGRLFDAVSAILGICSLSTYDGEAAIRLSEMMSTDVIERKEYPFQIMKKDALIEISFAQMIEGIAKDVLANKPLHMIVQAFHLTIVIAIVETLSYITQHYPVSTRKVVFSGGSFHNVFLTKELRNRLVESGFDVYTHQRVPCNDGGLAYGQLIIAAHQSDKKEEES